METIHVLALLAGAINIYAFWRYNKDVFIGGTIPNAATWFLWAFVTVVQVLSFNSMNAHWTAVVTMATDSVLCVMTFSFLFYKGKFGRLNGESWVVIGLSAVAIIMWQMMSATYGNIMSQVPYAMAFLPTIRDSRSGRTIEDPQVWVAFTLSFVIALVVTIMKWSGDAEDFISPAVAIVMHAILVYYAFRGRRLYAKKV